MNFILILNRALVDEHCVAGNFLHCIINTKAMYNYISCYFCLQKIEHPEIINLFSIHAKLRSFYFAHFIEQKVKKIF